MGDCSVNARANVVRTSTRKTAVMAARDPWAFITASYLNSMMQTSLKKPLAYDDIPSLNPQNHAAILATTMHTTQDEGLTPITAIFLKQGHYFVLIVILKLVSISLTVCLPLVLQAILLRLKGESITAIGIPFPNSGIGLCFLLFAIAMLKTCFEASYIQLLRSFQFNLQTLLTDTVFRKAFSLSNEVSSHFDEGRILSLLNIDIQEVAQSVISSVNIVLLPIQIGLALFFLSRLISWGVLPAAIAVGCIFLTMLPIGGAFTSNMSTFMKAGDGRVKLLREILQGIRIIKMRNLEQYMVEAVEKMRTLQLKALFTTIIISVTSLPSAVLPLASILLYARSSGAADSMAEAGAGGGAGTLNPAVIFPALTLFGILFEPLETLPASVQGVSKGYVALSRISRFLAAKDRKVQQASISSTLSEPRKYGDKINAIVIEDGELFGKKKIHPVLA
ncbi:ABC transporter type 1, transmembrane domain-containing protein [Chytridium lagenaria]|nr:ABC transporter type 1, transmembrane domain-containing protein [Chytridium lagenaria]